MDEMSREKDGGARIGQLTDDVPEEIMARRDVEPGCGVVKNEEQRPGRQGYGHLGLKIRSARKRFDFGSSVQRKAFEEILGPAAIPAAVERGIEVQERPDPHPPRK